MANYPIVGTAKSFTRLGKFPLDSTSLFETMELAEQYLTNPTSYEGQIIAIKEDNLWNTYIIDTGNVLKLVGSALGSAVVQKVNKNLFPTIGDITKIYIDKSTNIFYYWDEDIQQYRASTTNMTWKKLD